MQKLSVNKLLFKRFSLGLILYSMFIHVDALAGEPGFFGSAAKYFREKIEGPPLTAEQTKTSPNRISGQITDASGEKVTPTAKAVQSPRQKIPVVNTVINSKSPTTMQKSGQIIDQTQIDATNAIPAQFESLSLKPEEPAPVQPTSKAEPVVVEPVAEESAPGESTAEDRMTPDEALGMEYTQDEIDKAAANSKKIVATLNSEMGTPPGPATTKVVTEAKANLAKMNSLISQTKKCNESAMTTATVCLESGDSGIQSSMSALGQLAPAIGMMSMNDTCSKFSKLMTLLNGAMAAYRAVCAAKKLATENTCKEAEAAVRQIKLAAEKTKKTAEAITATTSPADLTAKNAVIKTQTRVITEMEYEASRANKYTPAYGMKIADGKAILLQNAGANILQVAGTMMSGQKCDEGSKAATTQADICQQYPSICATQSAVPIPDYCVTNPNDITCVCATNVNDPACSGARSIDPSANGNGPDSPFNPGDPGFSLDDSSLDGDFNPIDGGLTNGGDDRSAFGAGADGAGGNGDFGSGAAGSGSGSSGSRGGVGNLGSTGSGAGGNGSRGSGAGGLGSGFSSGDPGGGSNAPGAYGSGFNTDIASEGGSAGGASGGGDGRNPSGEDLLKEFLPGGEKDPKKGGALDGITGSAGLSIFQKVTRGYRRNTKTLIPE